MRIPVRYAGLLFAFILSGLMTMVVTAVLLIQREGLHAELFSHWLNGFIRTWPIAFPSVLLLAPWVRKQVARWTAS